MVKRLSRNNIKPRSPRFAIGAVMVKRLSRNNIKGNPKRQENVNQFHFLDVFILPNLNFVKIFIKRWHGSTQQLSIKYYELAVPPLQSKLRSERKIERL
jgi:hypothetical protein